MNKNNLETDLYLLQNNVGYERLLGNYEGGECCYDGKYQIAPYKIEVIVSPIPVPKHLLDVVHLKDVEEHFCKLLNKIVFGVDKDVKNFILKSCKFVVTETNLDKKFTYKFRKNFTLKLQNFLIVDNFKFHCSTIYRCFQISENLKSLNKPNLIQRYKELDKRFSLEKLGLKKLKVKSRNSLMKRILHYEYFKILNEKNKDSASEEISF
jgi:hypothetical protein